MREKILSPQTIIPATLYVNRDADRQIRSVIQDMGRPGYILVARQMGKTNLLINAKRECKSESDVFAYVDLSKPFQSASECFRYIIDTVIESLPNSLRRRAVLIQTTRNDSIPAYKEHENELRALLALFPGKLIISVDEIDSLTNSSFSDQIFAQIRSVYFSRINISEFSRLTYILSGVVDPNDIIKDKRISPFNIGQKIYLDDFSESEFYDFLNKARLTFDTKIVERIYHWTQGNPRMTWDICSALEDHLLASTAISTESVDTIVNELYLTDFNKAPIDHIRELVSDSSELRTAVRLIHRGDAVSVADSTRGRLYLTGVVASTAKAQNLTIKNPVIGQALSQAWLDSVSVKRKGVLRAADERYEDRQYKEALRLYDQYMYDPKAIHPDDLILVNYRMAMCAYYLGDYNNAVTSFEKALLKIEDQPQLYYQKRSILGVCHFQLGNLEKGISCFQEVVNSSRRDAIYARSLLNLASLYANHDFQANQKEVVRIYNEVIQLCTSENKSLSQEDAIAYQTLAHLNLGRVLSKDGKIDGALRSLRMATSVAPTAGKPFILASLYPLLKDEKEKLEVVQEAINTITQNQLTPASPHPEEPLRSSKDTFNLFLREAFFLSKELFARFAGYALTPPTSFESSEQQLYYSLAIYSIRDSSISKAISFLDTLIADKSIDWTLQYHCLQLLSALSTGPKALSYYKKYYNRFTSSSRSTSISSVDFIIFEKAAAEYMKMRNFAALLDWVDAMKREIHNTDHSVVANFSTVYFWEMRAYRALGRNRAERQAAEEAVKFIGTLPVNRQDALMSIDEKSLSDIKSYAESLIDTIPPTQSRTSEARHGRNDWVRVRYFDGNAVRKSKFKHVESDIKSGRCIVIEDD